MSLLRAPEPGDLGWITQVHGEFYARTFGWGTAFEGIVARIVADFADSTTAPANEGERRQRCWIAEHEGERAGSVMLSRDADGTARLRLMLVLERARGQRLGQILGEAVIEQARAWGEPELVLWTTDQQVAARALYRKLGFERVASEPNRGFAAGAMDETWRLRL
ncbi:MAG: GNAT family N-acetyltransferase [Pseudomonadota bacterium]